MPRCSLALNCCQAWQYLATNISYHKHIQIVNCLILKNSHSNSILTIIKNFYNWGPCKSAALFYLQKDTVILMY